MSTKYYSTPEGRRKKKELNSKRGGEEPVAEECDHQDSLTGESSITGYLRSVLSMVEGRRVTREEIEAHRERWDEELRQYRLVHGKKVGKLPDD